MAKGFVYLVAIMDWYSRRVLSWKLSTTMDTDFCIDALKEAIERYGCPEIFNTDQGSQFTSEDFTSVLKDSGIKISMDGKGRWVDNVFVERLWRSVKYEEVYLKAYDTVAQATSQIAAARANLVGNSSSQMAVDSTVVGDSVSQEVLKVATTTGLETSTDLEFANQAGQKGKGGIFAAVAAIVLLLAGGGWFFLNLVGQT